MNTSPAAPDSAPPSTAGEGTDLSISLARANLLGLPVFLGFMAIVIVPFALIWTWHGFVPDVFLFIQLRIFLPVLIAGAVLHELLHALGWMIAGRQPASVFRFGIQWKLLTPYAHCTVPLHASAYRLGSALPGVVLGVFPSLYGIVTGNSLPVLFGSLFLGAAAGDALVLWIIRSVPGAQLVKDHPTRAGCVILDNQPPAAPAG